MAEAEQGTQRAELIEGVARGIGVEPLTAEEIDALLALAGAAAHGTGDRTSAPLVTFLAGMAASGGDRAAALADVRRAVGELDPER